MDGTPFGRYRLLGSLGEGGMGQVFRAYDPAHDREVALKVLSPFVAQDPTFERRFRHEAHVAARLNDPHVVPIHSYGEIDGRFYVDMLLIEGRDLGSVLEQSGPMDPARAVKIIDQVADALEAAHSINLVHRDIKPSNVLLTRKDFAYLIDFGIAQDTNATRMTKTGLTIGTFAYMAPERIETGEAALSSDIYSLACVLYECLTGELPFPGDSIQQQIAWHLSKPPPRPSMVNAGVPQEFDDVIARGMAKKPAERYPTVTALAEAALHALDHHAQAMPRQIPPEIPAQRATTPRGPVRPQQQPRGQAQDTPDPRPRLVVQSPAESAPPLRDPSPDRPARRPANFTAPGVLLMVFAAIVTALGTWGYVSGGIYYLGSMKRLLTALVFVVSWLEFALAFGMVAALCAKTGERMVVRAAWLTCAAGLVAAMPWAYLALTGTQEPGPSWWWPFFSRVALVFFGIAAKRTFGQWWFAAALVAGLYGIFAFSVSAEYQQLRDVGITHGISTLISIGWLIPVAILGIAMCRTRIQAEKPIDRGVS